MGQPAVGIYPKSEKDDLYTQSGAEITYYIISVDDAGFAQLQAQVTSGGFVLELPQNHTVVSNPAIIKR